MKFTPTGGATKVEQPKEGAFNSWANRKGPSRLTTFAVLVTGGAVLYRVAPNTFLVDTMRQVTQNYTQGWTTRTNEEMVALVAEAASDLGLSQQELAAINVYVTNLSECVSFGSHKNRSCGSAVGYPAYFHLQSTDDIALDEMRFGAMSEAKESKGKLADELMS